MPPPPSSSVLDRARDWPEERRREAERLLEAMEQAGEDVYGLSDDERRLVQEGLDEAMRGELVADAEMDAFWRRHDK